MAIIPGGRITKKAVDNLAPPPANKKQVMYWDSEMRGFGISVARHSKTYIAQHDVNGRAVRITIGKHGVFTPEEARREARDYLNRMARGEDPRETKRRQRSLS